MRILKMMILPLIASSLISGQFTISERDSRFHLRRVLKILRDVERGLEGI